MANLNLKLTLNSNGSVTANWSKVSGAVRYEAHMYQVGQSYNIYNEKNLTSTTYTSVANLKANEQYKVTVSAIGSTALLDSEMVKILIPLNFYDNKPLTVPQNVSAVSDTVSATVSFSKVERATSYDILFNGTVYNTTATSRRITGLSPKTSYNYAVRAKNATQTGAYSTTRSITTLPVTPAVPGSIKKTATENSATISWGAVSGATGYDLIFNGSTNNVTDTSKTFTGLTSGKSFSFQIRAKNKDASSAYSTAMTVTTAPAAPTTTSATSTDKTVTVSWGAVTGATGYIIRFNNNESHTTGTSANFTSLSPNTAHTYQICSKSADGSGSFSSEKTVWTLLQLPTSVTKTSTENSVTISWVAVSGASSYDVIFNGTSYNATGTSKTFTGLLPDTSYTYKVGAKNINGTVGVYSTEQTVRTTSKAPANANAATNENSITISWSAVAGAKSYDILFNGTKYNLTGTSKTFTGLSANTGYTYQVRVNNADGSSSYSALKTVKTAPTPPAAPSASATNNTVTLSWNAVNGATSYDILFDGKVYNATGTSKTISGLTPGTTYTYSIRSNNADGSSSYSSALKVTTIPNPPGMPTNVSASATPDTVTISWSAVTGATSYDVLFNNVVYSVTSTSRKITGLTPGTSYRYSVRANNTGGSSSYTTSTVIQTPVYPPTVPTGVGATAATTSVTVSFSAVSGATGYDILFNGTAYHLTGTSKTFTGLSPNTSYSYAARAKNSAGTSAYSTTRTIRTLVAPPVVPTNVSAIATATTVTVSWSTVSGATSYDVLFNDTAYRVTGTSKTFTGLPHSTRHTYAVRANNAGGSSAYSAAKAITTLLDKPDAPLGITTTSTSYTATVSFYPVRGATSYDILFNGTEYNLTETSKTFSGLSPNKEYTFSIRAKNAIGASTYKNTRATTRVGVPENIKAATTINSAKITWDPVGQATSYEVEFDGKLYSVPYTPNRASRAASDNKAITSAITSVNFRNLKPNTQHSFKVRAIKTGLPGDFSSQEVIRTKIEKLNGLPNMGLFKKYLDGILPYMGLDPVNALTGAFLWSYTYLEDYGKDALHFTAMYDSQRDEYPKALGSKWTYSFNYLLYMDEEYAYFSTPYDEVIPFKRNAGNGDFPLADGIKSNYVMGRKEDQTYFIKDLDGTEYIFTSNLCLSKIMENGLVTYRFESNQNGQITHIKGMHGAQLDISYTSGRISRVADAMGNAASFTYEGDLLTSAKNPEGNGMSFVYDDFGNLLKITDFSGNPYLTNEYDTFERVIAQSTAGRGNSFGYYEDGATTFMDENGNKTKYYYNADLCVTEVELEGSGLKSKYNESRQLTEQIDGVGNTTKMEYDEKGRMNHVIHPDGTEERTVYNDRNYPVQIINQDGAASHYEYDERNNLISAQDERGNTSTYSYDRDDNLITYKDKNGQAWTYAYDPNHHLEQAEDPEGNIYKYSHDAIGRLVSYTTPTGKKTAYHYSGTGDLLRIVDEAGTVTFSYNKNGNQTGVTDRMGNKQRLEYNEMGQVTLATDAMNHAYKFDYDKRGNLVVETDPLGYNEKYEYDALKNCTAWTDKNGNKTTYSFDAASQLTEVKDASGKLTKYAYDTMGQVKTVTDALSNETNYSYDEAGRIIGVTNALGDCVSYTYDQLGNLLTKTDEDGVTIAYTYDKENRLSSIESELGIVAFTYDKLGRVIAVQDTDGFRETARYDGDGNITEFLDKESGRTGYVYDKSGRLSEAMDPNGAKTLYAYDENSNCIKITDAEENTYLYEYDANNQMIRETNPLGYEVVYEYDPRGDLKSVTDQRGGKTSYEYDGNGNLIRKVNPIGGVMIYVYDKLNRLQETEDEEGYKRFFVYDANGNMTSHTDANQNKWTYEYDAVNRLTGVSARDGGRLTLTYTKTGSVEKVVDQEGAETHYRYDPAGRLVEMSDALGNSLSWAYDCQGRVIAQTDANGNTTEYEYSPSGNLLSVKEPEGNLILYTHDALGRILKEADVQGSVISYEYDALGQVVSITDALGAKTSFTYTADGEIADVTDANGGLTQYKYDACGNLSQVIDPLGNMTAYEYDAMNNQIKECLSASGEQTCVTIYKYDKKGRMVREINPVSDEKAYTYDANGNIITILDEDEHETTVRYDLNNRPVNMRYSDGREAAFRYNKRGELVELRDWNGVATMEYGETGRLAKVTDHNGKTSGYGYDANGNITNIDYPDGSVVTYAYDKNNRKTKVTDGDGQDTQYEYDLAGNVLSICQPGSTSSFSYNAKCLPVKAGYRFDDGTSMEQSFTYDAMGKITHLERKGNTPELTQNTAYTYDTLGRLLRIRDGERTEEYGYDALGNRTYKNVDGNRKASYQYNQLNQLVNRTENGIRHGYNYDRRGNLTGEKRGDNLIMQYLYDAAGHMSLGRNLENGEKTEYGYNGLYMRVRNEQTLKSRTGGYQGHAESDGESFLKKEKSYVIDYLSDANNELMTHEKGYGTTRAVYGPGYGRLSQKVALDPETPQTARTVIGGESIGTSYFQPDLWGSMLFAANGQGEVLRYAQRSAWGELNIPVHEDMNSAGVEESLRFTNYSYDEVIGKHYAQARFYDAGQGRMLGRDPVKRGLNAYPYCDNDPVNHVDPTGEIPNILIGGAIGGIAGGIYGFAGSALSQVKNREKFSVRKAAGSAANGAITGAAKGALTASGAGIAVSLATNFVAGAAGRAVDQKIGTGKASFMDSMISGASSAVGGLFYGNKAMGSAKEALLRGAGAGGSTAAIESLYNTWKNRNKPQGGADMGSVDELLAQLGVSPYASGRDPRSGCALPSPGLGYSGAYGYQYKSTPKRNTGSSRKNGFSLGDFLKDVAIGAAMGGLWSATSYGAGKAVESLKGSIRSNKGGLDVMPNPYDGVKEASEYLQSQGVPREYRKQILESFDVDTIKLKTAGDNTYGMRFYGGNANAKGRYLFETFSPLTNRNNLALPYEWNSMTGIQQFQVKKGTTMITGNAAAQSSFGSQYVGGIKQWYINSLEDLLRCQ